MAQINITPDAPSTYNTTPVYDEGAGTRAAVSYNLTWAIALVLIIAAMAVAIVYVAHNVMH